MRVLKHELVDLYFQAGSNNNLDGVSTALNLLIGDFMVNPSSKAFSGRGNTIRMAWSSSTFRQPRQIQTQGGTSFLFIPMNFSPTFRS
jgi:hypothetical protein